MKIHEKHNVQVAFVKKGYGQLDENKIVHTCVCVCLNVNTGWNDKIVVLKKTTLQLYFKTFIEKNQFR